MARASARALLSWGTHAVPQTSPAFISQLCCHEELLCWDWKWNTCSASLGRCFTHSTEGNSYPLRTFPHFWVELMWNTPTDGGEMMSTAQLFLSELKWTSSIHLGLWAVPELTLLMPWLCCFWTPISCSEAWVWQLGLKWLLLINNMEVYMSTCCAADSSPSRNCTFKLGRVLKMRNVSVALEGSNGWRKCRTALFFFLQGMWI